MGKKISNKPHKEKKAGSAKLPKQQVKNVQSGDKIQHSPKKKY